MIRVKINNFNEFIEAIEDVKEKTVALQEAKERLDSIKISLEIKSIDD